MFVGTLANFDGKTPEGLPHLPAERELSGREGHLRAGARHLVRAVGPQERRHHGLLPARQLRLRRQEHQQLDRGLPGRREEGRILPAHRAGAPRLPSRRRQLREGRAPAKQASARSRRAGASRRGPSRPPKAPNCQGGASAVSAPPFVMMKRRPNRDVSGLPRVAAADAQERCRRRLSTALAQLTH